MQNQSASFEGPAEFTGDRLLLVTKFVVPPVRPDLVARPRLVEQLQRASERPLTLLAAPAGFGKTTALSAWLEHALLAAAWVSLERGDDDLTRFWSYVFTAVERIRPGSAGAALTLLQRSDAGQPLPTETILTTWINGLSALPSERAVLILDDYHLVSGLPIHQSVAYLVDHLPAWLHLVLATRADPPLPLARLRARGHLTEIRAAALRFTVPETTEFLEQTLGRHLSPQDIEALEQRTEGWIAGLQLAALSMQGRQDVTAFLKAFTGSQRYIIDYLTEEVLARQPEPVQTFLLRTCVLERLAGALCEAVIGEPGTDMNGQGLLEQIEQANLFLTPLDDERHWYRYHQLFAEALRHRLYHGQPALVPELHRRASAWYEQQGLTDDAVHHALAASDFALAARLVEQAFQALVKRGEIAMLQRWAGALPQNLIDSSIELSILQAWLLFVSGKHEQALRQLELIERTLGIAPASAERAGQEPPSATVPYRDAIRGRIAALRASVAVTRGDSARTIELSRLALASLPKENMSRSYAAWYLGRSYWLRGEVSAAGTALAEALRVGWEVNHLYTVFMVAYDLAHVQRLQGHLQQAERTYRQALARAQAFGGDLPAVGPAYVGLGTLEYEWNHLDIATSLLEEGITFCERTGNGRAILEAHVTLAFIAQARGETERAQAIMQQALQRNERQRRSGQGGSQGEAAWVRLSLLQGDEAATAHWLQHYRLSLEQGLAHVREREYLTAVRVLIVQGRLDEAMQWLSTLRTMAEEQGRTGSRIELLVLQARALHALGEGSKAVEQLAQALQLAEPEGYIRLFVDEGEPLAQVLLLMRRRWLGPPRYRDHLLELLGKTQEDALSLPLAGSATRPLAEPLSERELEVLRLLVAGCSNREIAEQLVLSVSTVKWYVNVLYGKLQVESRTKAIARARELRIV